MVARFEDKLVFQKNLQKELFESLMRKEELSQRKLAALLGVGRTSVRNWKSQRNLVPESICKQIFLEFPWTKKFQKNILKKLPKNWGQMKGGKARGKMKSSLTLEDRIRGFKKANLLARKRRVLGPKGERMYNNAEKNIAEFLLKNNFDYQYETVIRIGKNFAVPDFIVKENIIERCGYSDWHIYWSNMRRKLRLYNKYKIGKVIILVPEKNFNFAIKRLRGVKDLTILKENEIEILNKLLGPKGP